jgi:hypothetical protein
MHPHVARRQFLQTAGVVALLPALRTPAMAAPAQITRRHGGLQIYQPKVETNSIYIPHPGRKPLFTYNHDSDLVCFKGRYFAVWNANTSGGENTPGQFNYLSVSSDGKVWSTPTPSFTAQGNAENAIELDNQWQPGFVNFHDEILFCAWCTFTGEKTFVSHSKDGTHWVNVEVPTAPRSLQGKVVGFPTTHGLLSRAGVIMFPCSLPVRGRFTTDTTRYAAILFSTDRGRTWEWSEPIEGVSFSDVGEDPKKFGGDIIALWEPSIWENHDGTFGLLVRNSTAQDPVTRPQRFEKPHLMILTASSGDGRRWSKARPIEVDSLCARMFAFSGATTPDDLQMVMNDWPTAWPERISSNRYFLALFCAPVSDPDLLLPGPVLQPTGGRAHYPNGFVQDGRLWISYTYNPGIHSSVVQPLPNYSAPFLLPRGGRTGLIISDQHAILQQRHSSLGLVLTAALTRQAMIRLEFSYAIMHYDGAPFTVLTVGGKTRRGLELAVRYDPKLAKETVEVIAGSARRSISGTLPPGEWNAVEFEIAGEDCRVRFNGSEWTQIGVSLLRKISFGGLYKAPEWPIGVRRASDVRIALDSIRVT